jgi:uncharacterized protein YbjT (DUF2867 family)
MRIIVSGGTGLIGSKVVHGLTEHGHDAIAAAPSTGVNTYTGEGLSQVLLGASAVVDVSNSPTLDGAAKEFFTTATTNLLEAEADAGISHHVALSVIGTHRLAQQSEYFQAKQTQEKLISAGPIPVHHFNLAVAIEGECAADGKAMGRAVAESTFHHFADWLHPALGRGRQAAAKST